MTDRTTLLVVVKSYYKQTGEVPNNLDDLKNQYQKLGHDLPRYEIENLYIQLIEDERKIRIKYVMNERSFDVTIDARR
ncbi:MAG: hypothetical protein IH944_04690 [Armatimonadetes bacterium]|nr:hypothetical protein [Armatimonadota bacterium]